jgi:CheY-specific phosphatase CheX
MTAAAGYLNHFAVAIKKNLSDMAATAVEVGEAQEQPMSFSSRGFAVIVGITGQQSGRIIFDTDSVTAKRLSDAINGEDTDEEFVLDTMAEVANIISGNGISLVNNANPGLGLMLTPPSVFLGEHLSIVSPKMSAEMVNVKTDFGDLLVSIGFEGGR